MATESSAASAASRTGGRRLVLVSSDGYEYEVSQVAASLSAVIGNCLQGLPERRGGGGGVLQRIRLRNVAGRPLAKVFEYCDRHAAVESHSDGDSSSSSDSYSSTATSEDQSLKRFDAEFLDDVDQAMLYDLVTAADGLEIKGLFDLCCKKIGDMIRGKTPEQIRQTFRIRNDFTADDEAEIRRDNGWLFNNQ